RPASSSRRAASIGQPQSGLRWVMSKPLDEPSEASGRSRTYMAMRGARRIGGCLGSGRGNPIAWLERVRRALRPPLRLPARTSRKTGDAFGGTGKRGHFAAEQDEAEIGAGVAPVNVIVHGRSSVGGCQHAGRGGGVEIPLGNRTHAGRSCEDHKIDR